jgi:hypothetical protein
MDGRRLGMGAGLPQTFLEASAPGYLTDAEWDALGEDWLARTSPGLHRRPAQRRSRVPEPHPPPPGQPRLRTREDQPASMAAAARPLHRLADYLDQHGRAHCASQIPRLDSGSTREASRLVRR